MAKIMKIPKSLPSKKRKSDEDSDDGDYVPASDDSTSDNKTLTSQRSTRPAFQDNKANPTDKVSNLRQELPQPDDTGPRLRLAIDIGTTWIKAAFQFYESSNPSERTQVWPVAWDSDTFQTPSTLTYQNGKLLWGAELERQLSVQAIPKSRVMRHFKLAPHSDTRVKSIQDKVMALLEQENKTIYELFIDYMAELIAEAKRHIFFNNTRGPAYDANTIPIDIVISVPQCWAPESNVALTEASK